MKNYCFQPAAQPVVPIQNSDLVFPVRRILCVGRNYAAHRREMGGDDREPPFFFAKPVDAITPPGVDPSYPSATGNLHHEVELVVALSGGGTDIATGDALSLVFGYAVGVDLTRRDLQASAREKGQPWDASKGFDQSAPISAINNSLDRPPEGAIRLSVNGASRQSAGLTDMIWNVAEIIAEASRLWRLAPGDLIYTGTPEGVGPLTRGDLVEATVEGAADLRFKVV